MKEIAIRKDVIKKDVFYETEKASERMEDMHLFIQTALENRNFFTVGSWSRQILFGRRPCQSLREKEKVILRDINDGITPYGDNLTVLELSLIHI